MCESGGERKKGAAKGILVRVTSGKGLCVPNSDRIKTRTIHPV